MKKMKNYIIIGLLFIVIIVYSLYCMVETRSVMMEIRNVEQVNESDLLYAFAPKKAYKIINVKRNFALCWRNTGRIWISMQYDVEHDKEIVPDYCELVIRKENGKWKVIEYINTP